MPKMSKFAHLVVAAVGVVAAVAVSATARAEITWTLSSQIGWTVTSSTDCGTSCGSLMGNTRTFSGGSGSPTATASAWSNTGGLSTSTNSLTGTLETAYLGLYSGGLGVKNRDGGSTNGNTGDTDEWVQPEHAVDNQSRYDSVLVTFSQAVDLNKVTVGYISDDSDITLLAYTGGGTPTLTGNTYSSLTSQGWTFVGHYTDLGLNSPTAVNAANISSQYWLIGTYIPAWGTTTYSSANDHVKLLALYGDTTKRVPEPGAILLLGVALVSMWAVRRRKAA